VFEIQPLGLGENFGLCSQTIILILRLLDLTFCQFTITLTCNNSCKYYRGTFNLHLL